MTGIVILAAGESKRLGRSKQLLEWNRQTLIEHAIQQASLSRASKTIVVLGAAAAEIRSKLNYPRVTFINNPTWETGMASSIKKGIESLLEKQPEVYSLILLVCDQPFVDASLLDKMIALKDNSTKGIVACAYADTLGTPVLFHQKYFDDLLALEEEKGAKKLLAQYPNDVIEVDFPQGIVDIDTEEDYERIKSNS